MSLTISAATGLAGQQQPAPQAPNPAPPQQGPSALAPPLNAPGAADTGNRAGDADAGGARDDRPSPAPARLRGTPSGPTPYVALPTVDAAAVAAEIERAEAKARFAAPEPAAEADPVRRMSEGAEDREANAAARAAVQPPPENAPSLREDARTIRAAEAAHGNAGPTAATPRPAG